MANGMEQQRIYTHVRPMAEAAFLARQQVAPDVKLPTQIRATGMPQLIQKPKITKPVQTKMVAAPNMNAPINPKMNVKVGQPMMNHPHYM
jgi:hypothetical protein